MLLRDVPGARGAQQRRCTGRLSRKTKKWPAQGGPKGRLPKKHFSSLQRQPDHKLKLLHNISDSLKSCKFFVSFQVQGAAPSAIAEAIAAVRRPQACATLRQKKPAATPVGVAAGPRGKRSWGAAALRRGVPLACGCGACPALPSAMPGTPDPAHPAMARGLSQPGWRQRL